jgi:DsbC/DsbD-like thiol-disulfide interchange protein
MMCHPRPGVFRTALLAAALAIGAALVPAAGQAQLRVSDLVHAELRPGWMTDRGTRMAALHLRLADGWKTYWRIPGEAGIAPRLDWSASQNLADVRVFWPRPVVFDQGGFRSIGYHGELVLPLELTPQTPGRPIALTGTINIGVCDDVCVPVDLTLSAAMRGPGSHDPMIARALDTAAQPAGGAGLRAARCGIEPGRRGMDVTLRATLPRQRGEETIVMELPGTGYWVSDSRTWREGGDLVAQARVRAPGGAPISIDRSRLAFTILSADRMLEHLGCIGG